MSELTQVLQRGVCRNCGNDIVLYPDRDADAPYRWMHMANRDYRCLIFAEPIESWDALQVGARGKR